MIVAFALAIGTLGPAPDAPQLVDTGCVRGEPVVKPKRKGPIRKRLFKSEPKPIIEEGCETLPPASPAPSLLEVEYGYSVPLEPPERDDVPLLAVPRVETPECGCFGPVGGYGVFGFGLDGGRVVYATTTPAPEAATWSLVGLGLLACYLKTKPKKVNFLADRNADS